MRCLIEGAKSAVVPQACYVYTVPYSEVSGTRSPNSRTVLNMEPVLRNVDHLLKVYGGRPMAQERRELARCRTGAKGLEDFEQLKADAREGRTNLAPRPGGPPRTVAVCGALDRDQAAQPLGASRGLTRRVVRTKKRARRPADLHCPRDARGVRTSPARALRTRSAPLPRRRGGCWL